MGIGIMFTTAAAVVPMFSSYPPLTSSYVELTLPLIGEVTVPSALVFDAGVYVIVIGLIMLGVVVLFGTGLLLARGATIAVLWGALAETLTRGGYSYLMGCASIPMMQGGVFNGDVAASIWRQVREKYMAPIEFQVRPRLALPLDNLNDRLPVEPPALIKGYLRLGTKVLGAPAWDPDFNTADLPMMMRIADLPARYRRHFLGA